MKYSLALFLMIWVALNTQAREPSPVPTHIPTETSQPETGVPATHTPRPTSSTESSTGTNDSETSSAAPSRPTQPSAEFITPAQRPSPPNPPKQNPKHSASQVQVMPVTRTNKPELTGFHSWCAYPGEMLTVQGSNLLSLSAKLPALEVNGKTLFLTVLNKTDDFLVIQLPQQTLSPSQSYPLVLAEKLAPLSVEKTGLTIRLCPVKTTDSFNEGEPINEVLVFSSLKEKIHTQNLLQKKNLDIIETYDLLGLNSVMFRIRTNNTTILVKELTRLLPHAQIDINTNLTASNKPRLYAKDTIQWPKKPCKAIKQTTAIGLIDGAIDHAHIAFFEQKITSENFLDNQQADTEHATAIASILIGNAPEQGFDGLIPGTELYSAIVLRRSNDDKKLASTHSVLQGLNWLITHEIRLINVSLATNHANRILIRAFEKAIERGTLIFAAVGNQGANAPPTYPATIDGIFGITAIDALHRVYSAANQGDYVDFSAPGVDIWTAALGNQGHYQSGTSFASPYVMALASQYLINNRSLSRDLIVALLKKDANDLGSALKDTQYGWGLINAASITCTEPK